MDLLLDDSVYVCNVIIYRKVSTEAYLSFPLHVGKVFEFTQIFFYYCTLPKFNIALEKLPSQKGK